jgi:hypothetical protein
MKVVFLDIDGVLINKASLLKMESVYVPDEKCVQRLNDLIEKTDAVWEDDEDRSARPNDPQVTA